MWGAFGGGTNLQVMMFKRLQQIGLSVLADQQELMDNGCNLEDQLGAMNDRDGFRGGII